MKTISLKNRLITTLSLLVLFFLIQAFVTWYFVSQAKESLTESTTRNALIAEQLGDLAIRAQQIRRDEKEYFVYVGNTEKSAGYIKDWSDTYAKISSALVKMQSNKDRTFTGSDLQQIDKWIAAAKFYETEMRNVFASAQNQAALVAEKTRIAEETAALKKEKNKKTANAVPTEALPQMFSPTDVNDMIKAGKDRFSNDLVKGVDGMIKAKVVNTLALAQEANETFQNLLMSILATVAAGILVAVWLMLYLPKTITRPIEALTSDVDRLSLGELVDTPFVNQPVVEFRTLSNALERLRTSQQMLLSRLRGAA
jgi:nitrogen fixation/metabolism regulation signal transduction histidine kinase